MDDGFNLALSTDLGEVAGLLTVVKLSAERWTFRSQVARLSSCPTAEARLVLSVALWLLKVPGGGVDGPYRPVWKRVTLGFVADPRREMVLNRRAQVLVGGFIVHPVRHDGVGPKQVIALGPEVEDEVSFLESREYGVEGGHVPVVLVQPILEGDGLFFGLLEFGHRREALND